MDEERKYGVKRENEGSQPDSLVEIVSESTKTPDRREREDWLARAINYCVGLLSDQLFEIGYGTMKTICQTVPSPAAIHRESVRNYDLRFR